MTDQPMGTCNKCGVQYPAAPVGTVHKCGKCSGGIVEASNTLQFTIPSNLPNLGTAPSLRTVNDILLPKKEPQVILNGKDVDKILELNGPLWKAINQIVTRAAVNFANRREAGSSGSMNGALDYVEMQILSEVRKALGLKGF